jgi:hypothetical protein
MQVFNKICLTKNLLGYEKTALDGWQGKVFLCFRRGNVERVSAAGGCAPAADIQR